MTRSPPPSRCAPNPPLPWCLLLRHVSDVRPRAQEAAEREWERRAEQRGYLLAHRTLLDRRVPAYLLPAEVQANPAFDLYGQETAFMEDVERMVKEQARAYGMGGAAVELLQRDIKSGLVEGDGESWQGAVREEAARIGADELEWRFEQWQYAQVSEVSGGQCAWCSGDPR